MLSYGIGFYDTVEHVIKGSGAHYSIIKVKLKQNIVITLNSVLVLSSWLSRLKNKLKFGLYKRNLTDIQS